jgi:hypothetical protein
VVESVYSAVRADLLYKADYVRSLKVFPQKHFPQVLQTQISLKSVQWQQGVPPPCGHADGRTDRHKKANSRFFFRNFANSPKNGTADKGLGFPLFTGHESP